ncbi:hypothetical protein Tco_0456131 [Tanacetum coccineum]
MIQEPNESTTTTPAASKPSQDKCKAKMIESEKPLKKKDQLCMIRAMMDADYQMAQQLQAEEPRVVEFGRKAQSCLLNTVIVEVLKFDVIKDMFGKASKELTLCLLQNKVGEGSVNRVEEEASIKELMNIVPDEEEVAIDAIPLATKPPCIEILTEKDFWKTLWKLVKARWSKGPEEGYERVLWGDLMTMFEPDVESLVWRTLQNEKVLIWKLFDSCGVHFLRSMSLTTMLTTKLPLRLKGKYEVACSFVAQEEQIPTKFVDGVVERLYVFYLWFQSGILQTSVGKQVRIFSYNIGMPMSKGHNTSKGHISSPVYDATGEDRLTTRNQQLSVESGT